MVSNRGIKVFSTSNIRFGTQLMSLFGTCTATGLRGVEVGVHQGLHSVKMLNSHPLLRLVCVDMWELHSSTGSEYLRSEGTLPPKFADVEQAALWHRETVRVLAPYGNRVTIRVAQSTLDAKLWDDETFDFVYLDADHSREAVEADIKAWYPKVKVGGCIAGHDYGMFGVTEAVTNIFSNIVVNRAPKNVGKCWLKVKE